MKTISRFMALDCATTNTGFAIFQDGAPVRYGKLYFDGNTEYEKVMSTSKVMSGLLKEYPVGAVIIESSFFGSNPKVAINLAMSQGAALGAAALAGVTTIGSVVPSQWQRGIGNGLLTREERSDIMSATPGKSAAWYKARGRDLRKRRTRDIVNNMYNIDVGDNDVADALGIGCYVVQNPEGVVW